MRRISSLFLAAWMCVGLVGCSGEEGAAPATDGPALEAPADGASMGSEKKEDEGSGEKEE